MVARRLGKLGNPRTSALNQIEPLKPGQLSINDGTSYTFNCKTNNRNYPPVNVDAIWAHCLAGDQVSGMNQGY